MFKHRYLPAAVAAVMFAPLAASAAAPKSDDEQAVYAIGYTLGQQLATLDLSKDEIKWVQAGLLDASTGDEAKVDMQAARTQIQTFAQARATAAASKEKVASTKFLDKAAGEKGAVKTESGLIYVPMKEGSGEMPAATDTVSVHYTGTLRDGTVFDSSRERGQPASFGLDRVIKCWTEGVAMMKVGGRAKLVCPSDIAYGDRGSPPSIGPGAALSFDVELLSIEGE